MTEIAVRVRDPDFIMPGVAPISAPDFVREVREDFNSPTTSNFVNRIPQCKETVAKLEEVRH